MAMVFRRTFERFTVGKSYLVGQLRGDQVLSGDNPPKIGACAQFDGVFGAVRENYAYLFGGKFTLHQFHRGNKVAVSGNH
ncbi:hypothetical protein AGMMS49959_01530 [Planctomycetales bacterium]|nr:hypothetical protein AGMMS49959_01530 [Planctomycetales bacterium]